MYNPITDFLGLVRRVGSSASIASMPGLDFVVSALARAGMFTLWTGQNAPTVNFTTTVWLKPSSPSWVAEGVVYLYNAISAEYEIATPELWDALLSAAFSSYSFQSVTGAAGVVSNDTSLLAIQRTAPAATVLQLPSVTNRGGKGLQVVDWSTGIVEHAVIIMPAVGATIMRAASWTLFSTPDQLTGVTLYPSTDLNGWVIAP